MGIRRQEGFTIIETTLFLAASALLIVMMIAGTGASLNLQRYRDATESFKSLFQQQYADLSHVQNGRDNNWTCNSSATITENGSNDAIRGQSRCLLIGKYLRIEGGDIGVYSVIAAKKSTAGQYNDDIESLSKNYNLNVAEAVENRTMEWGTQIAWATDGPLDVKEPRVPRSLGVLFVRSPDSGLVYTFTSDTVPPKGSINQATFTSILQSGAVIPGQKERMVCIESSGLFVNGDMALYIAPYASAATSIETRTNDNNELLQGEDSTKC